MQCVLTGCKLSSVLCGQHAVCIDRVSTVKCVVWTEHVVCIDRVSTVKCVVWTACSVYSQGVNCQVCCVDSMQCVLTGCQLSCVLCGQSM